MSAKLNYIIPSQRFELIRDRIAQILVLELANQKLLTSNDLFDAVVWIERFIAFDKEDLPAINVYLSDANYDNQTPITARGKNTYNIDIHTSAKHENGIDGDKLATFKLHKLAGVIRTILESPDYLRLDFENGIIQNTEIVSLNIGTPNESDGCHSITGRLVFTATANEITKELTGIDSTQYDTTVLLGETTKGFFYRIINV